MSDRPKIGLDNPAFQGRLRRPLAAQSLHAPISPRSRHLPIDILASTQIAPTSPVRKVSSTVAEITIASSRHSSMDGMVVKKHPARLSRPALAAQAEVETPTFRTVVLPVIPKVRPPLQIITPQPYARPAHAKQQRSKVLHRRAVKEHFTKSAIPTGLKTYSRTQLVLIGMAGFIFLVGIIVSIITLQTNTSTKAQVAAISSKAASSGADGGAPADAPPSEVKPSVGQARKYTVAPQLPKYIKIGSIGVDARILPMGITVHGDMQAPSSIYDAGWYNASARPGDSAGNGAILIDGHVHGPTLPGIFNDLKKVAVGATMQIVRGDDKVFTYRVVRIQNYDAKSFDMSIALTSAQPGMAGLNVLTCGGPYNKVNGEYTQRTIAFAVLQS